MKVGTLTTCPVSQSVSTWKTPPVLHLRLCLHSTAVALSGVTGIIFRGEDRGAAMISIRCSGVIMLNNSQDIKINSLGIKHKGGTITSQSALTFKDSTLQVSNVQKIEKQYTHKGSD